MKNSIITLIGAGLTLAGRTSSGGGSGDLTEKNNPAMNTQTLQPPQGYGRTHSMVHSRVTRTMGFLLMFALIALIGCSENNPMSSTNSRSLDARTLASTELYGRVATIDPVSRAMTLVGNSTPIQIDADAEVVFKDGGSETPIELTDINPGDSAEVRGVMSAGTLMADRLRIRGADDNGNEMEFGGRVASVDPVGRTIALMNNAMLITVLPNAEIVQKSGGVELPIELADFHTGDSVDIRGTVQADGSLAADRVRLRVGREDFSADLEFKSTVTEIDYANGTFMVAGRTELITTDANTFIFVKTDGDRSGNGSSMRRGDDDTNPESDDDRLTLPIAFTDIAVGDTVEVYANVLDAATLYATVIELEDGAMEHALEVEFKDVLASIDLGTGTVTFVNSSWVGTVVAGADLAGLSNEPLSIDAFSAGEIVEIKAFQTGENTLDIVRMHKDNTL